jgi:formylglycine-generating enzyme required for sulfatase activity
MKRFAIELAGYLAVALITACWSGNVQAQQSPKPAAEAETLSKTLTLDLGNGVKMELVLIPAGEFMMGNKFPAAEAVKLFGGKEATYANEYPRHKVTISKPFYMGVYEVTQAQWETLMDSKPYAGKMVTKVGPEYPVSWAHSNEAIEYCSKLSKKLGKTVKLPTEAQWEYACRAGSDTAFCYGDDPKKIGEYGWFGGNMIDNEKVKTYARKGGLLKPNAWGLYDMHGNVWEWCRDWYSKDIYASGQNVDPEYTTETKHSTSRGGSWYNGEICLRSAARNSWTGPNYRHYNYGFRVIVEPDSSPNDKP